MDLVALLTAFYGDTPTDEQAELIALAQRAGDATYDEATGRYTWPDGAEPLTPDEIAALSAGLVALAEDETAGTALLGTAADVVTQLRTEVEGIEADHAAEEAERQANIDRLRGTASDATTDDGTDAGGEGGEGEGGEGEGEGGDAGQTDAAASGEQVETPEPVTAAGQPLTPTDLAALARRTPPAHRAAPATAAEAERSRITFAAGVDREPTGDAITLADVNEAITERFAAFQGSNPVAKGVREKVRVARVHARFSDDRRLVDDRGRPLDPDTVSDRVAAVYRQGLAQPANVLAAGGLCAPLQPIYGVDVLGNTARPIRDQALASFQANRGGVVSMTPPRLSGVMPAVGLWTVADDEAATEPGTVKSTLRVTCGDPVDTEVQAIYVQLLFGNLTARTFAEWTNAWTQLSMVAHSRVAEQQSFNQIVAQSTTVSAVPTQVSATRDLLNTLARGAAAVRQRNRELATFPFRAILPQIAQDIMIEDLTNGMASAGLDDVLAVARARIDGFFAARNINVTWSPDLALIGEQTEDGPLAAYPPAVPWALYPEGMFLHLDAGTLDLGIVRDSALIETNDYKTFMETFEAVHRIGNAADALTGTINLCPSGATYGTLDPAGRCASYT